MTHFETARIHEMLGLQIGVVQDLAAKLKTEDLEQLESVIEGMEKELLQLRSMLAGLPHRQL